MLYDSVEPFGSPRDDERAGVIASVIANVNRDPKKRPEPFLPGDFFAREPVVAEPADPTAAFTARIMAALRAAEPRRFRQ